MRLAHGLRIPRERRTPREHLEEEHAERVEVGAHVQLRAFLALLRAGVFGGSGECAGPVLALAHWAREPEVDQADGGRREEHVLRLQIEVQVPRRVDRTYRVAQRHRAGGELGELHRAG